MKSVPLTRILYVCALTAGLCRSASAADPAPPAHAAVWGVNHYGFAQSDEALLRQLSSSPLPVRMTFYWHDVAESPDYYDQAVAAATQAGVPILGILGYSCGYDTTMPAAFDFTEVSPFAISWHDVSGRLDWGSDAVKYVWNTAMEDGRTYRRVVAVKPSRDGRFVHGRVSFTVPNGKSVVLWAKVGFRSGPGSGSRRARFSITYPGKRGFSPLASLEKSYDGALAMISADLTRLAGTTVQLFFNVDPVAGYGIGDPAWQSAGILVDGVPLAMSQVVANDLQSMINYPPEDYRAFAAYAAGLARRYPQITEWEVWNEPNTAFFWRPQSYAAAYTALLKEVHRALKAANPGARVILGGLSPGPATGRLDAIRAVDFLSEVYHHGGAQFFDAVGYHAYGAGPPEQWLAPALASIHDVMTAHADAAKPVWITEIGFYTNSPGAISESSQAEYLLQARAISERASFLERVYWFTLRDASRSSDPEKNYGLFRADGSPKPAVQAFSAPLPLN